MHCLIVFLHNFEKKVSHTLSRYFEGRNDIQIGYKTYSVLLFSWETYERWRHLGLLERGGNLWEGEGDWSRKGGVWPPLPTMVIGSPKI